MKRYIAFLRGINISGKNKILMADLRECFEELGFIEVRTYLNSGNTIFTSHKEDDENFSGQIQTIIKDRFGLSIPVCVICKEDLEEILRNAPDWWDAGKKELYDNLIFIIPPTTFAEVFSEIGDPKEGLEKITGFNQAIFWSFSRNDYQKTNWWSRTASATISNKLTIRTANTVKRIVGM